MQMFEVLTGYDVAGLGAGQAAYNLFVGSYQLPSGPLNVSETIEQWAIITQATMYVLFTPFIGSILGPSVVLNGLSSINIAYQGEKGFSRKLSIDWPGPNTPAGDYWTLLFQFNYPGQFPAAQPIPISFLPTGEIDRVHTLNNNLNNVTETLAPTAKLLAGIIGTDNDALLKLFNWLFVSYYWVFLADFGQAAPSVYAQYDTNYASIAKYPSTNNIFANQTLFQNYYSYMETVILSILHLNQSLPEFQPVVDVNQLQPMEVYFLRNYSCVKRELKGWVSCTISVIVADYTLIVGMYEIVAFILGWIYSRKDMSKEYKRVSS